MLDSNAPGRPALDVVVVDDSVENAELLGELLESYGHTVRLAGAGAAALALLDERPAGLVFLDLTLPDMAGEDVAREIRTRWGSACRVVALTGHSDHAHREAALAAGCITFLVKPLRVPQLEQVLTAAVEAGS